MGFYSQRLRTALREADFTVDAVVDRIGADGQAGLGRNSTVPADFALADALDPLAVLIRLFILQQAVPAHVSGDVLDVPGLLAAGLRGGVG